MLKQLLLSTLLLVLPAVVDSDYAPKNNFIAHYAGTKNLWDARMGIYSPDELDDFVRATYVGTAGDKVLCEALAGISILECGPKIRVRDKTGHLGGHKTTIRVGAREAGIAKKLTYQDLRHFTRYERTLSLSKHFAVLYRHYNGDLEKTCRVWNKGPKWKNEKAGCYWRGVQTFAKIYDSARPSQTDGD
jgi:hypothetical protein